MDVPFAVRRRVGSRGIEFESDPVGDHSSSLYGERLLDVETYDDRVEVSASRHLGRNRDNYDHSADADISLCEEDVRELHLLLTVWLEGRG